MSDPKRTNTSLLDQWIDFLFSPRHFRWKIGVVGAAVALVWWVQTPAYEREAIIYMILQLLFVIWVIWYFFLKGLFLKKKKKNDH